jgi:hypothetical protein
VEFVATLAKQTTDRADDRRSDEPSWFAAKRAGTDLLRERIDFAADG